MDNNFENNDILLAQWLSGELKGDALKSFEASKDFKKYKKIIDAAAELKVPSVDVKAKLEAQKKYNASLDHSKKTKIVNLKPWLWSAAAAIAILLVALPFMHPTITVSTEIAETKVHVLPDGSELTLNAASSITYQKDKFLKNRTLKLDGEAYFKVQKGSTFTVNSSSGSVQVLGTAFNIYDRSSTFKVYCNHGKIKVTSGTRELILKKNMAAFAKPKIPLTLAQNKEILPTWRDGKSTFTKATLNDVFAEMERQFDVKINSELVDAKRLYTGFFSYNSLETALHQVCTPMNVKYTIFDNKITLSD